MLHADTPQQRQYLAFRFWPDSTEKQARTNLRQLLHNLRRALPLADHFIVASTQTLQWHPDAPFTLDVASFEQALIRAERADRRGAPDARRQTLEEAVRLYTGDLLPGCYDEWIEPKRERLRQQYIAALDRLVRLLEQQRAYQKAIPYAVRLLQEEPLRETTYRALMRLHALLSDRASALRVYHRCATVLEEELGVEPDPATRQLHERLLNMQAPVEEQPAPSSPGSAAALPLVGRQSEWNRLGAAWHTATHEQSHLALIAGEAGVGKTRLAEELLTWAARQGVTTARTRCYAAEGRLAFAPVADWLRAEVFQISLPKLETVWRAEVARILPELLAATPDLPPAEPLTESWQRRRFFEALARAVLAAPPPMVLLIDDLQWCDRDTLEWLHYLLRFDQEAQMLLLGTMRIEEVGPAHPLEALLLDLRRTGLLTEILLGPLDAEETTALAEHVTVQSLEATQAAHLYRETEGNPLFVIESVRAGHIFGDMYSASPTLAPESPPASPETLPPKVHAILTARLAQCSPPARELAHLAAIVGRAFTFDVLAEASDRDEDTLIRSLDELWQRRIVREYGPDAYDFSHDKLREVAYAEVSPVRRRLLHRCVAEAFETIHEAALDAASGQLAAHYERAGLPERAIPYYQRAAQAAQRVYANEEAIIHLNRALALLDGRPPSPQRDASELALLVLLGSSVAATRGFAASETGHVYARARTLCHPHADPRLCFSVYWGSYGFELVRAELGKAHAFSEQCRVLAGAEDEPVLLVAAHCAVGISLAHLGELTRARVHLEKSSAHLEQARAYPEQSRDHLDEARAPLDRRRAQLDEARAYLDQPRAHPDQTHAHSDHFQMGADPGVFSLAYLSHVLWLLGYPDQALRHGREALALAEEVAHPFSRVIALSYVAMLHQFRGENQAVSAYAEMALALAAEHGYPYYEAWGMLMKGWALHRQGERAKGMSHMRQGLESFRTISTGLREPFYLALLADACEKEGRLDDGLALLDKAFKAVEKTEERWPEADLHRLRGEMLLGESAEQAQARFQQALDVARQQKARSLELRAATSLSRLWLRQRRRDDARRLLKNVYDAFTEGFDAPDAQEAQTLLNDLS